jgi:hypothetical protein
MAAWLPVSSIGAFRRDSIFDDQEREERLKRKLQVA